jgi:hypothetical protein
MSILSYPVIAVKRLATSSIGPPLLTAPAIILAKAQQPITPAVMATAVMVILEISMLAFVAVLLVSRLLSMLEMFFMEISKVVFIN